MSIDLKITLTLKCDWPGCECLLPTPEVNALATRAEAKAKDWHRMAGLDICPIHPRHEGHFYDGDRQSPDSLALVYVDGLRLRCSTCGWADEDPIEPTKEDSQARWVAHLPELLGEYGSRAAGVCTTDAERGAVRTDL